MAMAADCMQLHLTSPKADFEFVLLYIDETAQRCYKSIRYPVFKHFGSIIRILGIRLVRRAASCMFRVGWPAHLPG